MNGIMVWAGISLGIRTDHNVFHWETLTNVRYRDEILYQYIRSYFVAIGHDFILMIYNARTH